MINMSRCPTAGPTRVVVLPQQFLSFHASWAIVVCFSCRTRSPGEVPLPTLSVCLLTISKNSVMSATTVVSYQS